MQHVVIRGVLRGTTEAKTCSSRRNEDHLWRAFRVARSIYDLEIDSRESERCRAKKICPRQFCMPCWNSGLTIYISDLCVLKEKYIGSAFLVLSSGWQRDVPARIHLSHSTSFRKLFSLCLHYVLGPGMDKHTQKPKQAQVSVLPMKRTNMSLCVFMFQCLNS
jgi:hypothetical protein